MPSWSDTCFAARNRSIASILTELYSSSGVLLVAFGACTCLHVVAFVRWKRALAGEKESYWKFFGWFTALAIISSVSGALSYGTRMHKLAVFYDYTVLLELEAPSLSQKQQMQNLNAESRFYTTAEYIFYPFEMAAVVLALLLVLHRVKDFVFGTHDGRSSEQQRAKRIILRSFVAVVVACILLSICSCFAASALFYAGATFNADAAGAYSREDAAEGARLRQEARKTQSQGDGVVAVARWADVAMLLLIVAAFIAMIVLCSKVFASALRTLFAAEKKMSEMMEMSAATATSYAQGKQLIVEASYEGRQLKRKIISTFTFAFLSLLLRTVMTLIYALASTGQNNSDTCAASHCDACKNVYSNIHGWLIFSPSFQMLAVFISSPAAMMVALWGMSGVGAIEDLTAAQRQMQSAAISVGRESK